MEEIGIIEVLVNVVPIDVVSVVTIVSVLRNTMV
jgi:hypothetical protein